MPQCPAKRIKDGEIGYCTLEAGHPGDHTITTMQSPPDLATADLRAASERDILCPHCGHSILFHLSKQAQK